MFPLKLTDGVIINLAQARMLIPYTDGSYAIEWENGDILELLDNDAALMTTYLTTHGVATITRTLIRPKGV